MDYLEIVRSAILSKEVTQEEIAEASGRTQGSLSRAINGEVSPSFETVRAYYFALLDIRTARKAREEDKCSTV